MTRVAVFIDYQNAYMRARECFGRTERPTSGQVVPRRLGDLLVARGLRVDPGRVLVAVHIARGEPSSRLAPAAHAAAKRQVEEWQAEDLVTVATRPLHYAWLDDGSGRRRLIAREKGVDVALAVEMLLGAQRQAYDVAVLFSADTDLIPAVEAVRSLGKRCEVAAWRPATGFRNALRIPGVWCHWLDEADYLLVHDPTDYTKPNAGE